MRLIDVQPVLDYSHNKNIRVCTVDLLEALPVVDAVPVVRCGECKNFKLYPDGEGTHYGQCLCWMVGGIGDDEYCSYGEKMEVEHE